MSSNYVTISISKEIKDRIDALKTNPDQSYNSLFEEILKICEGNYEGTEPQEEQQPETEEQQETEPQQEQEQQEGIELHKTQEVKWPSFT